MVSNKTVLIATMSLGAMVSTAGELVVNGGFESPGGVVPPGAYLNYLGGSSFPGWTVGGESIDIHDTAHTAAHSGQYSLDTAGFNNPGSISQNLHTVVGAQYTLDFWYAGHPYHPYAGDAFAEALWDGSVVTTVSRPASTSTTSMNWTEYQTVITATHANTHLVFQGLSQNGGVILDDISVTGPVAAPDSSNSALLFLLGTAALFGMRRVFHGRVSSPPDCLSCAK